MTSDPFICDLPHEISEPAPGTATTTSAVDVTRAELAWDRNPRNPLRRVQVARNVDNFIRHVARYRKRRIFA